MRALVFGLAGVGVCACAAAADVPAETRGEDGPSAPPVPRVEGADLMARAFLEGRERFSARVHPKRPCQMIDVQGRRWSARIDGEDGPIRVSWRVHLEASGIAIDQVSAIRFADAEGSGFSRQCRTVLKVTDLASDGLRTAAGTLYESRAACNAAAPPPLHLERCAPFGVFSTEGARGTARSVR